MADMTPITGCSGCATTGGRMACATHGMVKSAPYAPSAPPLGQPGKWGPPCVKCGHPSSYHGMTWCVHPSGAAVKRDCDCDGYAPLVGYPQYVPERPDPERTN